MRKKKPRRQWMRMDYVNVTYHDVSSGGCTIRLNDGNRTVTLPFSPWQIRDLRRQINKAARAVAERVDEEIKILTAEAARLRSGTDVQ